MEKLTLNSLPDRHSQFLTPRFHLSSRPSRSAKGLKTGCLEEIAYRQGQDGCGPGEAGRTQRQSAWPLALLHWRTNERHSLRGGGWKLL